MARVTIVFHLEKLQEGDRLVARTGSVLGLPERLYGEVLKAADRH